MKTETRDKLNRITTHACQVDVSFLFVLAEQWINWPQILISLHQVYILVFSLMIDRAHTTLPTNSCIPRHCVFVESIPTERLCLSFLRDRSMSTHKPLFHFLLRLLRTTKPPRAQMTVSDLVFS